MIVAACILLGIATVSQAQIEKGNFIGGINGNFSYNHLHGRNSTMFGLNAYGLYALENNLATGLSIESAFSFSKLNVPGSSHTSYGFVFTPELRKYFGSGSVTPYVGLASGFVYNYFDSEIPGFVGFKDFDFQLAPLAGISFWINEKVFFDIKAKYDLISPSQPGSPLNINFGIGFRIGK